MRKMAEPSPPAGPLMVFLYPSQLRPPMSLEAWIRAFPDVMFYRQAMKLGQEHELLYSPFTRAVAPEAPGPSEGSSP